MNISNLIGLVISLAVFLIAVFETSNNFLLFINFHAVLVVFGGTFAATAVSVSLPKLFSLFKVFVRRMLGKQQRNFHLLIDEIVALSAARRKRKSALEEAVKKVTDPFLRDAGEILFWLESDISPEKLRTLLETRANTHFKRYMEEANVFKIISKFPPAFGLMGTTLGMIALLQALGEQGAKDKIGPAMSAALVATLYGIVLANLVFVPISENLAKQTREDYIARCMVVEGIMLIAANEPTKFVEEHIKSFLLPSERLQKKMTTMAA